MKEKIEKALDEIRPFLQSDGGNIELISFTEKEVEEILNNTWHDFEVKDLINIKSINKSIKVLELFHGPTAAFKDFGLQ